MKVIFDSNNLFGEIRIRAWAVLAALTESTRSLLAFKTLLVKYNHKSKEIVFGGKDKHSPWYTYPFLEFINSLDFSKSSIFEYGSGYSTLYWATAAQSVVTVESNKEWSTKVSGMLQSGGINNVDYRLEEDPEKYAESVNLKNDTNYDIIIVDGIRRFDAAKASINRLSPSGVIILDNSDWCPDTVEYLISCGFYHMPFSGFGPANQFTWTTSLFFRSLKGPFFEGAAKAISLGMVKPSEADYMFDGEYL